MGGWKRSAALPPPPPPLFPTTTNATVTNTFHAAGAAAAPPQFFKRYTELLRSDNYVTRRQSLKLLGELLLDRSNVKIMMQVGAGGGGGGGGQVRQLLGAAGLPSMWPGCEWSGVVIWVWGA